MQGTTFSRNHHVPQYSRGNDCLNTSFGERKKKFLHQILNQRQGNNDTNSQEAIAGVVSPVLNNVLQHFKLHVTFHTVA